MSIIEKIKADQLASRKAKDSVATSLLTTLMSDAMMVAKNDGREAPTDAEVIGKIRAFLKSNAELQEVLSKKLVAKVDTFMIDEVRKVLSSDDSESTEVLSDKMIVAQREAKLLNGYLPTQLSEVEIRTHVQSAMDSGIKDMGSLMSHLKTNFAGLYDGKLASGIIKELLK